MAKTEPMSIRLSPEIKRALKEIAKIDHRPMNNMIEYLIIEYCRKSGVQWQDKKP